METVLTWGVPGGVLSVVAIGVYDVVRQRRRRRTGRTLSATYLDEVTAMFYGTKRVQLDHQESMSLMREEDAQGAPPRTGVDLDRGIVVLRPGTTGRPADGDR
ncbi:DUF6191 domain-containing protein [Actinosynnema sp. NPDC047251]|uniref:Uncharacterized protein n=1 Tax=Saccharothrix espanaensis (strain ATCC 51144 / DSM 44229 / JCM 9112 / NBRC 15066 / NRRL 15764) TaxID=1179773 RepID=K0JUD0_SACES|nr:DUF6191 domain-containing protein [Saccharothrix espanaensis]CCH28419.1 hypothetical protein BN6_10930 [Saccharothrix espanaensis DSM 44229]